MTNFCHYFWTFLYFVSLEDRMDDKKAEKSVTDFYCENCAFKCSRTCDWDRHLLTAKHKRRTFGGQKSAHIYANIFVCDCGKEYKYRQGLWKHEKICPKKMSNFQLPYFSSNEELIQTILKENHEVKQLLIEQNMKIMDLANKNTIINNTTNNMNNTNNTNNFNLQVFLNVQCKDALNMSEFVDSLQLQISDLEDTGRLGYIEGVSKIFIKLGACKLLRPWLLAPKRCQKCIKFLVPATNM